MSKESEKPNILEIHLVNGRMLTKTTQRQIYDYSKAKEIYDNISRALGAGSGVVSFEVDGVFTTVRISEIRGVVLIPATCPDKVYSLIAD